jgi:hypothetical protein
MTLDTYFKPILELEDRAVIQEAKPFFLGVLGATERYTKESILNDVINPILEQEGRMPTHLLLPAEGTSSMLLSIWAERMRLTTAEYTCDWKTLGRRARALRDARILKESTHLILFCGAKSDYYEKIAQREAKKGRTVFTVSPAGEITEWTV